MKKNDPNNFVFFYLKKQIRNSKFVIHNYDEENLNYFVSSIKKFHPDSKIIQCTDFKTPKVIGVDEIFRINSYIFISIFIHFDNDLNDKCFT